jgi:putative phosphoesterase
VRVAALYDIHGNLPALEAVLAEVDEAGADAVLVGGDVVAGPFPAECLDVLDALGDRVVYVRGNADREVLAGGSADAYRAWGLDALGPEHARRAAEWPLTVTLEADGLGPILFCHATPRSDEAFLTPLTPEDAVAEAVAEVEEDVVVYGHIHVQYERGERPRLVNPVSVGWPHEGRSGAFWALFGPDVEFRRTEYDVEAAIARIRATEYPQADVMVDTLLNPPTPEEATEHFEKLRGA